MSSDFKRVAAVLIAIAAVAGVERLIRANVPQVPSNYWAATGDMAQARAGASSTLLYDGYVLVTGGLDGTGKASATVERYSPDGDSFLPTPPMAFPRANHTSTLLPDGRVLVAGGIDATGAALSSVEIYDPATNAWAGGASLNVARAGHTATALYDGRVVIAGGDNAGAPLDSIELFDLDTESFAALTASVGARTGHAATLLYNGTVFVSGGFDGSSVLASTAIYDPFADAVLPGPALTDARAGHSATTLLDGKVLVAGGAGATSELASGELYDPGTGSLTPAANSMIAARQHHQAILLPHNNQVLIVGGTTGENAVGPAEVFVEWQNGGTFFATNAPSVARAWPAAAALSFPAGLTIRSGPNNGLALLSGGSAKSDASAPFAGSELYGFATVVTDKADYAPGTTVTITGSGWMPGETVTLTLVEQPLTDTHTLQAVVADGSGNIVSREFSPDAKDVGIRFYLTATGTQSQAQTSFTDAQRKTSTTVVCSPNPVSATDTTTCTATVTDIDASPTSAPTGKVAFSTTPNNVGSFSATGKCTLANPSGFSSSCNVTYTPPSTGQTVTITATGQPDNPWGNSNGSTSLVVQSQQATSLAVSAASGTYGGAVALSATLTSAGSGIAGKTITFTLNGTAVGPATTNSSGVAMLNNVSLSGISAGTYVTGIAASFAGDPGFSANSGTASLTVNKAPVTVTFTAADKVYDGATTASVSNCAIATGKVGSDDVTCSVANGTFASANASASPQTVSATATLGGAAASNYTVTNPVTTTAKINPAPVTVSFTAADKVYDGATTASVSNCAIATGKVGTDDVTCSVANGTFASANASASPQTVSATATLGGTKAGNYTVTNPVTTTAKINPAPVTVTFSAADKIYDGATTASVSNCAIATGKVGSDDVTCSVANGTFASADASASPQTVSATATLGGAAASNYSVTNPVTTTAKINPAPVTVTFTAADKIYDGTTTASVSNCAIATGKVGSDDVTCSVANGTFASANASVSPQTVSATATLGGAAASNYTVTNPVTTTAKINPAPVTASIIGNPTKSYDGTTAATLASANFSLAGVVGGESISVTKTTGTYNSADVAAATTVTAMLVSGDFSAGAGTLLTNYVLPTTASGPGHITTAPLTIAADADPTTPVGEHFVKTYDGHPFSGFSARYSGFVNGEGPSALAGALTFSGAGTTTAAAGGPYAVTPGGLTSTNYAITFGPGAVDISQAALTVTADADPNTSMVEHFTKTYDGHPFSPFTVAYSGFVDGEGPSALGGTLSFSGPGTTTAAAGGPYQVVPGGLTSTNYAISFVPGTVDISLAALTVTADADPTTTAVDHFTKTYDGHPFSAFTVRYVGFVNGETASALSGSLVFTGPGTTVAAAGGPYAVTPGGLTSTNYTITFAAGTVDIGQAPLTITADANPATLTVDRFVKTYDGHPFSGFNARYDGFVNGEGAGVLGGTLSFAGPGTTTASAGGPYQVTPGGLTSSNYAITFAPGAVDISKASLTVTADNKSKVYDGMTFTAFTATISGFVNNETSAVVSGSAGFTGPATTAVNPGTWTITPTIGSLSAANYYFTQFANGMLTIGYGTCSAGVGPGGVILPPINSDGTSVYNRKGGSTIPVKFRVCNAAGLPISDPAAVFSGSGGALSMLSAVRGTITDVNESGTTDIPDAAFRFDGSQWIFNMATSNLTAATTYDFRINLAYGNILFRVGVK